MDRRLAYGLLFALIGCFGSDPVDINDDDVTAVYCSPGDSNTDDTWIGAPDHSWCYYLAELAPEGVEVYWEPPFSMAGGTLLEDSDEMLDEVLAANPPPDVLLMAIGTVDAASLTGTPGEVAQAIGQGLLQRLLDVANEDEDIATYVATLPPINLAAAQGNPFLLYIYNQIQLRVEATNDWIYTAADTYGYEHAIIDFDSWPSSEHYLDFVHVNDAGQQERAVRTCLTLGWEDCE